MAGKIKVIYTKSYIGYPVRQKETVKGLGLKKLNSYKVLEDTPQVRGMINKVAHLVSVEDA